MKTIQLSERELSIVYSLMAPPYRAEDIRSDEFNELRNKVFYALRDAQNDEPVSNRDELLISWIKCSERMPEEGTYISAVSRHGEYVAGQVSDSWLDLHDGTSFSVDEVYLWIPLPPLPAAPQQEARKSNVIGSYQGADGQEHPIVSLSSPQEVK